MRKLLFLLFIAYGLSLHAQSISYVEQRDKKSQTKKNEKLQRLESFFAQGDYEVTGKAELYFHNAINLVFRMMGFYTEVERHTTDGRMDMLVKTNDYIYIFEFKLDKSADEALQQIEDKHYAKPFEHDPRTLYKIGVNFSSETRRVESWKISQFAMLQ